MFVETLLCLQPTRAWSSDPDDVRWADGFNAGSSGPYQVEEILPYANGLLFGGWFNAVGGVEANNIALFDGTTWRPLGAGLGRNNEGTVYALTVFNDVLYAGGTFEYSGNSSVRKLAWWTGTTWREASRGIEGGVWALAIYNGQLYAGTQTGVYRADPVRWARLPLVTGWVFDLEVYDGKLIAAGWNLTPAGHVYAWDGTAWDGLDGGTDGRVGALTVYGDRLIAGGVFSHAGGVQAERVASWDGTHWSSLDASTFDPDRDGIDEVTSLTVHEGDLIAGGWFSGINGNPAMNHVARWNGTSWSPMASGALSSSVNAFASFEGNLAAGGWYGARSWNGQSWIEVDAGNGVGYGGIWDFVEHSNGLVAAGDFERAGTITVNRIASWNETSWTPYPSGLNATVYAVERYRDELVAAGDFTRSGTNTVERIARWDGSTWRPLGAGLDAAAHALAPFEDQLVVAGDFMAADGIVVNRIARWNGSSWTGLGPGFDNSVRALQVHQGSLYAAGDFTATADAQTPLAHVAHWTGAKWDALGPGLDGAVHGLAVFGSNLIAVGEFTHAGTTATRHIAAWDGSAWNDVGGGVNAAARVALEHQKVLYVGGAFQEAGGIAASRIARWNGMNWDHLGSGLVDGQVLALDVFANGLYLGGYFWGAGDKASSNIARWDLGNPVDAPDNSASISSRWGLEPVVDSGSGQAIRIRYRTPIANHAVQLAIFDVRGRIVRVLEDGELQPGTHSRLWDRLDRTGARVVRGLYVVRLQVGRETQSRKLLLRHG